MVWSLFFTLMVTLWPEEYFPLIKNDKHFKRICWYSLKLFFSTFCPFLFFGHNSLNGGTHVRFVVLFVCIFYYYLFRFLVPHVNTDQKMEKISILFVLIFRSIDDGAFICFRYFWSVFYFVRVFFYCLFSVFKSIIVVIIICSTLWYFLYSQVNNNSSCRNSFTLFKCSN